MSARSEVVHCYDQLASITSHMLDLSRAQEWGQLPALEERCAALVERLKEIEPTAQLDASQRDEVRRVLVRVRADQDEVCRLVKPQLRQLVAGIERLQYRDSLERAYGVAH